ncbi:hypothetical protein BaRGS_00021298 [Batillaria attramentaria]|uniref:Poly [ADP-ribose] polymerase n=1 Tax=Batillaria attramentaria TaxID=370345 RepID=A0ABD0KK53_9CAEN
MSDSSTTVELNIGRKNHEQPFIDAIHDYFSNAENGGKHLQDICTLEDQGLVRLKYTKVEVAKQVSSREHKIRGRSLHAKLLIPAYPDKLLLKSVPEGVPAEKITKYIKAVTGSEPKEILYGDDARNIVVTLDEELDFYLVEEKCRKKKLGGAHISVEKVPISKCILVENLPCSMSKERVVRYFDIQLRHVTGGVVDTSKVVPLRKTESNGCYIYFKNQAVVEEVLSKDHVITGYPVKVKLYLPCLGPMGGSSQSPEQPLSGSPRPATASIVWKQIREYRPLSATKERANGEKQKVVETLTPIHLRLLVTGSIPEEISRRHKDLLVKIKQQGISFCGSPERTKEALAEIQQLLGFLKTDTVRLSDSQKQLIRNPETLNYIEKKMKERERLAEFEIDPEGGVLEVCAFSQPDLLSAVKTIRASMVERLVFFDDDASILQSAEWQRLNKKLLTSHSGKLLLLPTDNKKQVRVVGTDDVVHDVTEEIKAFTEENTLYFETVHCRKFVERFLQGEVESIEKELKHHRVQIFSCLNHQGEDGLNVQGTRQGLELAKEKLKKLDEKVLCHTEPVIDQKKVRFLNSRLCRQVLDQLEDKFRCIISLEPENTGVQEKEIREICTNNGVEMELDKARGQLTLNGDVSGVSEAREQIDDILHNVMRQRLDYVEIKIEKMPKSTTSLPDTWGRHSKNQLVGRVQLRPSDEEFKRVEASFRATLHGKPATVSKIERVQNRIRYQQYMTEKERLDLQNSGIQNERTLWHGTPAEAVDGIIRYGFNRSYCGKNAKKFGEGVYFAVESSYSAFNIYSPPDKNDNRHIFQCKVLVGHPTVGTETMKVLPERIPGILYDSATDSLQKPDMFVIFSDNQAYPEYLITFKVPIT